VHRRRLVVAGLVLSWLVPAGGAVDPATAAPRPHDRAAGAAAPAPTPLPVVSARTVHLITGDSVRVMTRTDGSTVSTLVEGPSAGSPVARWRTATSSYLMPRTPAAVRRKLDPSLFDVSRLARLRGRQVPVVVTLRKHRASEATSGVLDALGLRPLTRTTSPSSSRSPVSTRSVEGTYASGFPGLDPRDLRGVASIRLAGSSPQQPVAGPAHSLKVQVRTGAGDAAPGVVVMVENVDDADAFLETPMTNGHGNVTVQVPDGNYSLLAWDFGRLLVKPEVAVTSDSVVALDLADATVRPHVSLPDYRKAEAVLSVGRAPESGFAFPVEFSGPRFYMRVQPADADVAHGSLHTGVTAKLARVGSGPAPRSGHLAITADVSEGVPADLTYTHHRRDFARVVQQFFGNGPAGLRQTYLDAGGSYVEMFTGEEYVTPMPGRRVVLLQASRDAYYQQTALPQARPGSLNLTQLLTVNRYPGAGQTYVVPFAHGPVGPGVEAPGAFAGVTRRGRHLTGFLPLFSGAGSSMISYVAGRDGSWSLRQGGRLLRQGGHWVSFDVTVPPRRHTYVLEAESHPTASDWQLSTRVADAWTFHSSKGSSTPALLMPSYVPPTTLAGNLRPGPTGYRLTFHGLPTSDRITRASFELSTDGGRHWSAARLSRISPVSFRVRYRNPASREAHRRMSLRVAGRDARGNGVRETALNVYRLR